MTFLRAGSIACCAAMIARYGSRGFDIAQIRPSDRRYADAQPKLHLAMEMIMAGHPTCTWTGKSGKKYIYEVHPRHPKLAPHEPGNFIYAKRDARHHWVPICIGEGDLTQRARAVPGCLAEIDSKGATHVHVHVGYDRGDREAEKNDLLAAFPDAFAPTGWVERAGR